MAKVPYYSKCACAGCSLLTDLDAPTAPDEVPTPRLCDMCRDACCSSEGNIPCAVGWGLPATSTDPTPPRKRGEKPKPSPDITWVGGCAMIRRKPWWRRAWLWLRRVR